MQFKIIKLIRFNTRDTFYITKEKFSMSIVNFDPVITPCWLILSCINILCMCISSPYSSMVNYISIILIGLFLNYVFSNLKSSYLTLIMLLLWLINIGLIIYLLLSPLTIKGSRRWITIMNFSYQPSEISKLTCIFLIGQLLTKKYYLVSLLIFLITVGLLIKQPDLGNVVIISLTCLLLLVSLSLHKRILTFILLLLCICTIVIVNKFPHASRRIRTFYSNSEVKRSLDSAYQNLRALNAIKHGGLFGVGLGNGTVKQTIPDAYSDFIFAVIAEELGIIGCSLLCYIYLILFIRCIVKGMVLSCSEGNIVIGIGGLIVIQSWIHMATSVWLIPTKGTTLPFVSHGGVSIMTSHICVGILNNMLQLIKKQRVIR